MKEIKVAIVGFGGIARLHYASYEAMKKEGYPISVVAICEQNTARVFEKVEINLGGGNIEVDKNIHLYTDVDTLIAEEEFDMADICLPTFLHCSHSVKLLNAGKHVLCEKPMALTSEECAQMTDAANKNGCHLMIAQCLRFDHLYRYLKECVDDGRFGKLSFLTLERHCDYPLWGADFKNLARTGGCILDTHIHDVDIARFVLGEPKTVSAVRCDNVPHWQLVNSRLFYDDATVLIDVVWDEAREIPFQSGFHAKFEQASVVCDGAKITVKPLGADRYQPEIREVDRITEEIRALGDLVLDPSLKNTVNPPESAMKSVQLVDALAESAAQNGANLTL